LDEEVGSTCFFKNRPYRTVRAVLCYKGGVERLQKILAQANIASRRHAEELILAGHVKVNGVVIRELGTKADPKKDRIEYDGKLIVFATPIIYAFNKPVGVTSTVSDRHADKTIADFFPKRTRVYPVGRLDKMSKGLMLVTNDGNLAQELTHPSFEHEKEYEVTIKDKGRRPDATVERVIDKFTKSYMLDGHATIPMKVANRKLAADHKWDVNLILREGRNRQIRKVALLIGFDVLALKRVRIGKLELGTLEPGKYKIVSRQDIL